MSLISSSLIHLGSIVPFVFLVYWVATLLFKYVFSNNPWVWGHEIDQLYKVNLSFSKLSWWLLLCIISVLVVFQGPSQMIILCTSFTPPRRTNCFLMLVPIVFKHSSTITYHVFLILIFVDITSSFNWSLLYWEEEFLRT